MTDGPFVPEDDQEFLLRRRINHRFLREGQGEAERKAIEFTGLNIPAGLCARDGRGALVPARSADVLVLIPKGYSRTRLDSWYVRPALLLPNGTFVDRAGSQQDLFGLSWQFWSRHLQEDDWRPGIDGLETYLQYIRSGLAQP